MRINLKLSLLRGIFAVAGGIIGYGYYLYMDCAAGACGIGYSPLRSIVTMAFAGWLISYVIFGCKGCKCKV